jgi:hypothetical protein
METQMVRYGTTVGFFDQNFEQAHSKYSRYVMEKLHRYF